MNPKLPLLILALVPAILEGTDSPTASRIQQAEDALAEGMVDAAANALDLAREANQADQARSLEAARNAAAGLVSILQGELESLHAAAASIRDDLAKLEAIAADEDGSVAMLGILEIVTAALNRGA